MTCLLFQRLFHGCAVILVACTALQADAERPVGQIGAAQIDITPEYPIRMYGYALRKAESEGVGGRLKATALAIGGDQGDGPAVLLSVDSGAVPVELRAEVLRRLQADTSLRPERFMLCNSHSHSSPDLASAHFLFGGERERIVRYEKELTGRLEEVVRKALAGRRPGRLEWTQGSVGFAANRRMMKSGKYVGFGIQEEGPVDHGLPLLRATDLEGKPLALMVNYACHCTTLTHKNMLLHGDWAGSAREQIEADHPGAVALVTIGCGADMNPRQRGSVEKCRQQGRAMADEVKRLLAGPLKPVEPKVAARAIVLELSYQQILAAPSKWGKKPPPAEKYPIAVWTFGDDLAMVFLADEVVVDYALRMRRQFDGSRLWINAYANEVSYYVASNRLVKEGGYEVDNSINALVTYGRPKFLQPPLEDRIVGAVGRLLPENFRAPAEKPAVGGQQLGK